MTFSLIIFISFLCITAIYARNIIRSHRYMRRNGTLDKHKARNTVTVLIPVYREASIIAQTLDYFCRMARELDIKVIVITTEREGGTTKNPTYQAAKALITANDAVLLEHYPKAHGSKSNQLNWAMKKYESQTDYFAIFDADSRPDSKGIRYVMQSTRKPAVFQMPSIHLPHPSGSLASQAIAAFQTRWTYCFEIPKWRAWQDHPGKPHAMYVVGHGLFMRDDIRLPEHTLTEDLELGYHLSAQQAALTIVPFFDYALVPQKFTTTIIQSSRWYYGELLAPATFWRHLKDTHHILRYVYCCLVRYALILLWMVGPVLMICGLIVATSHPYVFALGLLSICLYWMLHVFVCNYGHASYASLIPMPVKLAINGVGPMLCVVYTVLDRLKIKEFQFVKTRR